MCELEEEEEEEVALRRGGGGVTRSDGRERGKRPRKSYE